jgi:hypothetical protein
VIVLNLLCLAGHRFDGWFASVDAFEQQAGQHLVNCPHCNSTEVQRLPSIPHVARSKSLMPVTESKVLSDDVDRLLEGLQRMVDSSEDVGDLFADEARRIHYNEAPVRNIKGQASEDDVVRLLEEGIQVLPIPKKGTRH